MNNYRSRSYRRFVSASSMEVSSTTRLTEFYLLQAGIGVEIVTEIAEPKPSHVSHISSTKGKDRIAPKRIILIISQQIGYIYSNQPQRYTPKHEIVVFLQIPSVHCV